LGASGAGVAIATDDAALAEFIRQARNYGEARKYEHLIKGGNWRLDTLQAAILRVKLRHLPAWNTARRRAAMHYTERLRTLPGVTVPVVPEGLSAAWHLY